MSQDLTTTLLTSPVLVAGLPTLITAVVAIASGRYLLQAKDERIATLKDVHARELQAKDERIAALAAAGLREELEAIKAFYYERVDQLTLRASQAIAERDNAKRALEQSQDLSVKERDRLESELREANEGLARILAALRDARAIAVELPGPGWAITEGRPRPVLEIVKMREPKRSRAPRLAYPREESQPRPPEPPEEPSSSS